MTIKHMPSKKNIAVLEVAREKVNRANAFFFVDYQGLTHKQLEEARVAFKEIASELFIIKNTLVGIALKEKNIDVVAKLQGPSAVLFSYEDPVKTAKTLYAFLKKYNIPASQQGGPKIKFGVFNNEVITEATVIELASLPSKEILLSKLVGLLKSPMTNLVYSLNWNMQKLVLVLTEIEKKKQN